MQKGHMASGTFTVVTADTAIDFSIGFAPDYVKIINVTAAFSIEWWADMADAEGYKTTGSTGVDALITTLGITPYAGTSGGVGKGFTLGADTDLTDATSDVLYWIAWSKD